MPLILQARGSTIQDLFQDAAKRLLALLIDPSQVGEALREKVVLEAPDTHTLLRDWINALLGLASLQRIIGSDFRFQEFTDEGGKAVALKAEVIGELVDPVRHVFRTNPSGLRCQSAAIRSESSQFTADITF